MTSIPEDIKRLLDPGKSTEPDSGPIAQNGQLCDCQSPGDWHRVANDFQRAMFEQRTKAARFREALQCIADTDSSVVATDWMAWARAVARNALRVTSAM